jgi:hypothetical protein
MNFQMLFVISAPRSGSTMLERMLESHSMIKGGPEPHLLTPLAHLGVWAKVDKAPYDHILSAEAQRLFVEGLPNRERDYWDACRAYCDTLYGRFMEGSGKTVCLDKTPAYGLILPFLMNVFPDAKYVVLTRHPLATFASYANSFFDGDYHIAQGHNPILNRYVPALAAFLRQRDVGHVHVRYEDLVTDPDVWMEKIYAHAGVPFERQSIEYGKGEDVEKPRKGLGDPIGVNQHTRPTTGSVKKWVEDLASDPAKLELMRGVIGRIDPDDLRICGYPPETLWKPLEEAGNVQPPKPPRLTRYRLQRRLIVNLRAVARRNKRFRALLERARLGCDVLLRE